MEIAGVIAENLRRLRMERNLSLGQLAVLCKISKVMLSQIERGEGNPTINTVWKIANGLKVPYTELMQQTEVSMQVVQKTTMEPGQDESGNYQIYCYYENNPYRNFELFQMELKGGSSYTSIGHSERSEEYIMVLSGELLLETQGKSFTLGKDEAIQFAAAVEHTYTACGTELLRAVVINYYPV